MRAGSGIAPFIAAAAVLAASALLGACTELKDTLPEPISGSIAVHPEGWTDPGSPNFHGNAIRNAGWDMSLCKTCHGPEFSGGTSGISCRTCHDQPAGPENCATCHGSTNPAPPKDIDRNTSPSSRGVGAHQKHLTAGTWSEVLLCSTCHNVPGQVSTPGHVDSPLPAEVPIPAHLPRTTTNEPGAMYHTSTLPQFDPDPVWSTDSLRCANVYCHGYFKNGNTDNAPLWTDITGTSAACGTCHGDPQAAGQPERAMPKTAARGGTHPVVSNCGCHSDVVDANYKIINKQKHMNGRLNVYGSEYDF